jgi:hypothetical protein
MLEPWFVRRVFGDEWSLVSAVGTTGMVADRPTHGPVFVLTVTQETWSFLQITARGGDDDEVGADPVPVSDLHFGTL